MRVRRLATAALLVAAVAFMLVLAGCGSGSSHSSSAAARRVTPGFTVGVMADGPIFAGSVNLDGQLNSMLAGGVESLRVAVDWSAAQPYPSAAQVPAAQRADFVDVGGVPTRFAALDRIVGPAAARGMSVLPVVEYTPAWAARQPGNRASAPHAPATYAAFMGALAHRYGPHGTYWAAHPGITPMPIRMWQIWNEPNFTSYWAARPFAPTYVGLVRAARAALKAADPGAQVVLAGLPDFSWEYLAQIYRVPGAARLFDVVAVHPYTAEPKGVLIILHRVRAVMDRNGDARKPMLATELSWPSSAGRAPDQFGIGTTPAQQAARLDQVLPLLAASRAKLGLTGFYWYTWIGDEGPRATPYAFDYSGLLRYVDGRISPKPSLAVFTRGALAIEGCRSKAKLAGSCG